MADWLVSWLVGTLSNCFRLCHKSWVSRVVSNKYVGLRVSLFATFLGGSLDTDCCCCFLFCFVLGRGGLSPTAVQLSAFRQLAQSDWPGTLAER